MLKQLLEEAKTIEASVELDSVFESVELSPEVKEGFKLVFEQTVKTNAAKLAEQHIEKIIAEAEEKVEAMVIERSKHTEDKLYEDAEKFFDHIAKEWLTENAKAVENDIKANLFESLLTSMKDVFVEHNVEVPADAVDVVKELESELEESAQELRTVFESKVAVEKDLSALKRSLVIERATSELAESQVEKVFALVEGIEFSDSFDSKVKAIVSMMSTEEVVAEAEEAPEEAAPEADINIIESELNVGDAAPEEAAPVNPFMASYMTAASRIK